MELGLEIAGNLCDFSQSYLSGTLSGLLVSRFRMNQWISRYSGLKFVSDGASSCITTNIDSYDPAVFDSSNLSSAVDRSSQSMTSRGHVSTNHLAIYNKPQRYKDYLRVKNLS